MRFTSTILIIYVLVLTLMPCSDRLTESQPHLHSTSAHQIPENEQHDCTQDSCTPFCTCSCCGISLNAANFYIINLQEPVETYARIELSEKQYPLISLSAENIWQPPQV